MGRAPKWSNAFHVFFARVTDGHNRWGPIASISLVFLASGAHDEDELQDRGRGRTSDPSPVLCSRVLHEGIRAAEPPPRGERKLPGVFRGAQGTAARQEGWFGGLVSAPVGGRRVGVGRSSASLVLKRSGRSLSTRRRIVGLQCRRWTCTSRFQIDSAAYPLSTLLVRVGYCARWFK